MCPYCNRRFYCGIVTLQGEIYKCVHCKVMFNDKLKQVPYIKLT